MKLEIHKDSIFFWQDIKIPKDIEKKNRDLFLFDILGPKGHFETLQLVFLKKILNSNLEWTSNKFVVWNCLLVWPTTIANPT